MNVTWSDWFVAAGGLLLLVIAIFGAKNYGFNFFLFMVVVAGSESISELVVRILISRQIIANEYFDFADHYVSLVILIVAMTAVIYRDERLSFLAPRAPREK